MEIEPANLVVDPGQTSVVTAYVVDGNGQRVIAKSPSYSVQWSLSDPSVATVNASGAVATVTGATGGAAQLQAEVFATESNDTLRRAIAVVTRPAVASIRIAGGNNQSGSISTPLAQPLVVQALSRDGFGVRGAAVRFAVRLGNGSVSAQEVLTDEFGYARATLTLGPLPGQNNVEAWVSELPSVIFQAAGVVTASYLEVYQGNLQQGTPGAVLASPISVRVLDASLRPLTGAPVSWSVTSGGGQVTATSYSDNTGVASAAWTLGAAGAQSARATVGAVHADFSASAVAPQVDQIVKISGDGQTGLVGTRLTDSLVVRVIDANGDPRSGVLVMWSVISGGGSASPVERFTDAGGYVRTAWTVGSVAGSAQIRATAQNIGNVTFNATIQAAGSTPPASPAVASLTLTPQSVTLNALNAQTTLTATAYDTANRIVTGQTISYTSSNPMIAIVDNVGRVTAKAVGAAFIVATALCCNEADTTAVTVTQQLASVAVSPRSASVAVGGNLQVSAAGYDANGNVIPSTPITWSSSNTAVATVSGGTVQGVTAGNAYIKAVSGTYRDSVAVSVTTGSTTTPVLTSITLTPANPTLLVGSSQTFTATAKDQNGNVMSGVSFTWSSSNTSIMTVNSGVVTALAVGLAALNVSSNGVNASTQVNVALAPVSGGVPLFSDNFDSGSLKLGGWKNLGINVSVATGNSRSGSHALKFHYPAKALCQDATAEQRFLLPNLNEVWIEYWFYLPANFEHRVPVGCNSTAANQKLLRVWGPTESGYNAANPKGGASFDPISGGPDSRVYVQWGDANNALKGGQESGSNWGQAFTDANRGKWMLLRWHFKLATSSTAMDGVAQLWVDGVLKVNLTGKDWWGTNGNWFTTGYLMGWANAGYNQDTDFYIDDFKVFSSNPGW